MTSAHCAPPSAAPGAGSAACGAFPFRLAPARARIARMVPCETSAAAAISRCESPSRGTGVDVAADYRFDPIDSQLVASTPRLARSRYPRQAGPVESPTRCPYDNEGRSAPAVASRPECGSSTPTAEVCHPWLQWRRTRRAISADVGLAAWLLDALQSGSRPGRRHAPLG